MKRTLYHGSENIINKPIYDYGNIHNDYGLGFYMCSNIKLAREWGARKNGYGYVNKYSLRDDRLKILDLTKGENDNVLMWITLLLENRTIKEDLYKQYPRELDYLKNNYLIDVNKYDVVIGYRADDAYFRFPESFIRSDITIDSLNKIYKAGDLGKQYVLISKRAFNLLKFEGYGEIVSSYKEDYYLRSEKANKIYDSFIKDDRYSKGIRMRDLVIDV